MDSLPAVLCGWYMSVIKSNVQVVQTEGFDVGEKASYIDSLASRVGVKLQTDRNGVFALAASPLCC